MEINKVYSGFRLDRIERIDEINGTAYEMKHEKSGARLIYIDSPDSNKVFNIAFRTTPHNSTGVALKSAARRPSGWLFCCMRFCGIRRRRAAKFGLPTC